MNNKQIKAILMKAGFTERDQGNGRMDLHPYVYDAARALLTAQLAELGWLPCSPELLASGVDCATAPRVLGSQGVSHYHQAAQQHLGAPVEGDELKPCPFCGGQVQLETVKSRAGTLYGVVCRNSGNRGCTCAMEQVPSRSAEAAIARWNMRKPEDELRAENEALRKDAERYRSMRKWACYFRSGLSGRQQVLESEYDAEIDQAFAEGSN